jgi:hypothetical protein
MYGNTYQNYPNAYGNPNMNMAMAMGGGMGAMMSAGNGGLFNNMFLYSGNPIGLQTRL